MNRVGRGFEGVTQEILGVDRWSCKVNVGRGFEGVTKEMLGRRVTKEISVIWNIKLQK